MTSIAINNQIIPAEIFGRIRDRDWDDRDSKSITAALTYEQAKALFVDDVQWAIVYQEDRYMDENGETVTPEPVVYDNSDYSVSGPITDNRDGTITAKMGKKTEVELLRETSADAEQAAKILLGEAE